MNTIYPTGPSMEELVLDAKTNESTCRFLLSLIQSGEEVGFPLPEAVVKEWTDLIDRSGYRGTRTPNTCATECHELSPRGPCVRCGTITSSKAQRSGQSVWCCYGPYCIPF